MGFLIERRDRERLVRESFAQGLRYYHFNLELDFTQVLLQWYLWADEFFNQEKGVPYLENLSRYKFINRVTRRGVCIVMKLWIWKTIVSLTGETTYIVLLANKEKFQNHKYKTCKEGRYWECEYPSHENRFDGISLESTFSVFMGHCTSNSWWENVCRRDREVEVRSTLDCDSRHECCNSSLCIGHLIFSNLFSNSDNDSLPPNHRSKTKRDRYHRNYPPRSIVSDSRYSFNFIYQKSFDFRTFFSDGFEFFLDFEDFFPETNFFWIAQIWFGSIIDDFFCIFTDNFYRMPHIFRNICIAQVDDTDLESLGAGMDHSSIEWWIDSKSCRHEWYQNKHSKTNSLLSIIRSMCKTHKGTRRDETPSNPCFWIFIPKSSRMLEKILVFYIEVKHMHRTKCENKSNNWRNEEWFEDIYGFCSWECDRLIECIHRKSHTEDGSNEGMWAWCRNTEIPCPKIPDNSSQEERKNHTDTKSNRLVRNHLKRKEVDNTHSYSDTSEDYSEKVKESSQENCNFWWKRVRIDNRCNSVRSIMKSVDKFKGTHK